MSSPSSDDASIPLNNEELCRLRRDVKRLQELLESKKRKAPYVLLSLSDLFSLTFSQ